MELITITLVTLILTSLFYKVWSRLYGGRLNLPGPSILEVLRKSDMSEMHRNSCQWGHKYGNITQVSFPGNNAVLLTGSETIHEAFITKGADFSGRMTTYLLTVIAGDEGLFFGQPTETWKDMQKVASRFLKKYEEGGNNLETIFKEQADIMLHGIDEKKGDEFNCMDLFYSATFGSICILIFGKRLDENDDVYKKVSAYLKKATDVGMDPRTFLLDLMPFLRSTNLQIVKTIQELVLAQQDIWNDVMEMIPSLPESSFIRVMLDKEDSENNRRNVKFSIINLLMAGTGTSMNTMYSLLNILLHKTDVKRKIEAEIQSVIGSRQPSLSDKANMPYTRATILEQLRYHSLIPFGIFRKTTCNTTICGHPLPKGITVIPNLFDLHHDEKFWGDPWEFRPERFLDESGDDLVPPDHPNFQHLLPFSAGPRVCLGEKVAQARLFIWIVSILQKFAVQSGDEDVTCDVRKYELGFMLQQPEFKVRFISRD